MDPQRAKNILEAALLCSVEPIAVKELMRLFDDAIDASVVTTLLEDLRRDWTHKGLELVQVKTGWRFQTREDVKRYLEQMNPEKPPKYSRATMETLAIIAYKQPVTRGRHRVHSWGHRVYPGHEGARGSRLDRVNRPP